MKISIIAKQVINNLLSAESQQIVAEPVAVCCSCGEIEFGVPVDYYNLPCPNCHEDTLTSLNVLDDFLCKEYPNG